MRADGTEDKKELSDASCFCILVMCSLILCRVKRKSSKYCLFYGSVLRINQLMQFGNRVSAKKVGSLITKHHFCSPSQCSRTSRRNYGNISGKWVLLQFICLNNCNRSHVVLTQTRNEILTCILKKLSKASISS